MGIAFIKYKIKYLIKISMSILIRPFQLHLLKTIFFEYRTDSTGLKTALDYLIGFFYSKFVTIAIH